MSILTKLRCKLEDWFRSEHYEPVIYLGHEEFLQLRMTEREGYNLFHDNKFEGYEVFRVNTPSHFNIAIRQKHGK